MRLLIKFPTKGRPNKFLHALHQYVTKANNVSSIQFVVSVDDDDRTVTPGWLQQVRSMHPNITVSQASSLNKVHAINRDMPPSSAFDIVLLASDDMIPQQVGYDDVIRDAMQQFFPDTDGVLFFNDGYVGRRLNTLLICGAKYYDRFGYLYNPAYQSLFCDNEFMVTAEKLGKQIYFDQVIIKHEHPANNAQVPVDDLYVRNEDMYTPDKQLWLHRREFVYDVTVLICTVPDRQNMLHSLLHDIQLYQTNTTLKVQVLFDARFDVTIGKKRADMLLQAQGKYCCFVDDDDKITPHYFQVIEDAIKSGQDYDCIQLNGRLYRSMLFQGVFVHSTDYYDWQTQGTVHTRPPNHLNPIKTDIAKQISYEDVSRGEDFKFSMKLQAAKLIKTEYKHNLVQYLYYYVHKPKHNPSPALPSTPAVTPRSKPTPKPTPESASSMQLRPFHLTSVLRKQTHPMMLSHRATNLEKK